MATLADALIDTAELTRGQRGFQATRELVDNVDHLSRFETVSATGSSWAKLLERERRYSSRGRMLTLRWKDFGQAVPGWFDPVMQGFANLITLEPNWDSYNGKPIDTAAIDKAMALLETLLDANSPAPSIVPLSNGGLQIEWHRNEHDLEIVIEPREKPVFCYYNASTLTEETDTVSSRLHFVIQLIRALE